MSRFVCCAVVLFCGSSSANGEGQTARSTDATGLNSAVRALLETGLRPGSENYRKAEQIWRMNQLAAKHDARVDYAWGLILRKHSRNREAERQFLVAARRSSDWSGRAREAAAWMKLARGQTASGLAQVDSLIRAIAVKKAGDEKLAIEAATWIGRVVAALGETNLSNRDHARLLSTHRQAEKRLKGRLREAYDAGLLMVELQVQKLSKKPDAANQKAKTAKAKQQAEREKKTKKRIASKRRSIDGQQKDLKLTVEQWEEWFNTKTGSMNLAIQKLIQEMELLESRRVSLARSMTLLSQEMSARNRASRVSNPKAGSRSRSGRSRSRFGSKTQARKKRERDYRLRKEQEYAAYYRNYVATMNSMRGIRRRGSATIQQLRAVTAKYEKATGVLTRRNEQLAKWEESLKQKQRELSTTVFRESLSSKKQKQSPRRFSNYVTFDIEAERKRLLAEFSDQKP